MSEEEYSSLSIKLPKAFIDNLDEGLDTVVGENELWVGVPAKCIKGLEKSYDTNIKWAAKYVKLKDDHKKRVTVLSSMPEDVS